MNILRRDPIIYYTINFQQQKDFCNFCDKKIVGESFNLVKELLYAGDTFKKYGHFQLKNYHLSMYFVKEVSKTKIHCLN